MSLVDENSYPCPEVPNYGGYEPNDYISIIQVLCTRHITCQMISPASHPGCRLYSTGIVPGPPLLLYTLTTSLASSASLPGPFERETDKCEKNCQHPTVALSSGLYEACSRAHSAAPLPSEWTSTSPCCKSCASTPSTCGETIDALNRARR